jgi:hypothetical protein
MEVLDPVTLIAGLRRVEIGSAAQPEIVAALESIRRVRARVDAAEVALTRRLRELTPLAERDVSGAAQRSSRHGAKVADREETVAAIPGLGERFESGDVSGEHVDAFSKAVKAAPVEVRDGLRAAVSDIVGDVVDSGLTPDELAVRLADETKRLEADDGVARLERQRGATRLRTWTDKHNGMFRISGQFVPFSGLAIHGRLQAPMAAMFAGKLPDLTPDDPGERQDFLRALALLALTAGVKEKTAPAKDTTAATKRTMKNRNPGDPAAGDPCDASPDDLGDAGFGDPAPGGPDPSKPGDGDPGGSGAGVDPNLAWAPFANSGPPRFGRAEVIDVVTSPHWINTEDQVLIGAAQLTSPIKYWRNGGKTDLINLIPLCTTHHGCVHSGWTNELGPNRELTITLPTGQTMTTGPPKRSTA